MHFADAGSGAPRWCSNPAQLRTETDAVQFVRAFFEAGKPVWVICHPIDADVVDGRTLTSWRVNHAPAG